MFRATALLLLIVQYATQASSLLQNKVNLPCKEMLQAKKAVEDAGLPGTKTMLDAAGLYATLQFGNNHFNDALAL